MQPTFEESAYFKPYKPIKYPKSRENLEREEKKAVWEELYERGLANKKAIEYRHRNNVEKMDEECTFSPKLRSKSSRSFGFNQFAFLERNNIWYMSFHSGKRIRG